jgi:hypothetical protein
MTPTDVRRRGGRMSRDDQNHREHPQKAKYFFASLIQMDDAFHQAERQK